MEDVVIAVAIVQMQELVGPAVMCVYPLEVALESHTAMQHHLVELLLPTSANDTNEDQLRIVTREFRPASPSSRIPDGGLRRPNYSPVFVAGAYKASREADGCRGSRQATVCLVLKWPLFTDMLKPLSVAAALYADGKVEGPELCHALYDSLRSLNGSPVSIPCLGDTPYIIRPVATDDSVTKLLKRESDVMHVLSYGDGIVLPVWRAIAQSRSVVIVGDTADKCTRFVIGCVGLVAPMKVPLDSLYPYVSTPSMVENLEGKTFIILGTTNEYFGVKRELGDVIANLVTKEVWIRPEAERYITPSPNDEQMMQRLHEGILTGKGDEWARLVMERHTTLFLQSLPFLEAILQREEMKRLKHLSPLQMRMVLLSTVLIVVGIVLIIAMAAVYA